MKEYLLNIKNAFKLKHYINYIVLLAVFALFTALYYAGALNRSTPSLFNQILYSVILAVSLNLVVGFLGELSLGHLYTTLGQHLDHRITGDTGQDRAAA